MTSSITRRATLTALAVAPLATPHIARAAMKKVRLGYGVAVIDPSTAPWLSAAKTAGFWQEEGLDVEVTGFQGAGPVLQLLGNNQLDAVFTGTPEAMRLRGDGIKAIANAYDRNHNYPVVLESSPIHTIEQFKGKRMGIQTMTGSIYLWEKVLLGGHHMTYADLAEVIPVGTGAPAARALQTGQIDILGEWHGQYAFLEVMLGLKMRRFDHDPALAKDSFVQDIFTRDDVIAKDPKMLVGLLRGIAKGIRFAIENPRAAVRGHFQQFPNSRPSGKPLAQAIDEAAKVVSINVELSKKSTMAQHWGMATPAQIDSVRDVMIANGIFKKSLDASEYFSPQFVTAMNTYDLKAVIAKAKTAG